MNEIVLDQERSDVNGDRKEETVSLLGTRETDGIVISNIKVDIESGKTYTINLEVNKGYNPTLFLGDFNKDNVEDIMIQMESGSTGLEGYFYIYSFVNNVKNELFNFRDFNRKYTYDVNYQNDYIVSVTSNFSSHKFNIDIKDKPYIKTIYNSDGSLKSKLKGMVSPVMELRPIDNGDGSYRIEAIQRVIGYYNADILGIISTSLNYENGNFVAKEVNFKRS